MRSFAKTFAGFLLGTITFIQASCKRADPGIIQFDPVQQILESKTWKLTALNISPALNGNTDYYNNVMAPCERDNTYQFTTIYYGLTFFFSEGSLMCSPTDPQTTNDSWSYEPNSRVLTFKIPNPAPGTTYNMTIQQINDSTFTGRTVEVIAGNAYTKTWIFEPK